MIRGMKTNSFSWIGTALGLFGGLIGLAVGLWAPFILKLSDRVNFIFLLCIALLASLLLLSMAIYLFVTLKGALRLVSVLILFGLLQLGQGFMIFLRHFDKENLLQNIESYFQYNIFDIMPFAFALFFIPFIFSQIYKNLYLNGSIKNKVLRSGHRSTATIVGLKETNMRVNKRRIYNIELEIESQYFGKYKHVLSRHISVLEVNKFYLGAKIDVAINPRNKQHIFIV